MIEKKFLKNLNEVKKHILRLENAFKLLNVKYGFPMNKNKIEQIVQSENDIMVLDQIAYRFSKLQDTLSKLLKYYLLLKGENIENMSMIDVINFAEKIGLNISKDKWFELRELRNILTHEYEEDYEEISYVINKIFEEMCFFKNLIAQMGRCH